MALKLLDCEIKDGQTVIVDVSKGCQLSII